MKSAAKLIIAPLLVMLSMLVPLSAPPATAANGEQVTAETMFVRVQIGSGGRASVTIGKSVLDDYDLKLSARNKSKLDKELPVAGGK